MGRSGSIGNGKILILFDENGYIRDFYYPYAGYENHVVDSKHRVGISIDSKFYWLKDLNPKVNQNHESFTFDLWAETEGIKIFISSIVYNSKNILIRKVVVENTSDKEKQVKIFFGQEFKINENKYRNTGYYLPEKNVVIHYKGKRAFLINISSEEGGIDDYNIGLFGYEGKEGSYKNAEGINLAKNPVEHGPVDSVVAKTVNIKGKKSKTIYYTVSVGSGVDEVIQINHFLNLKPPHHLFNTTYSFWKAWAHQRKIDFCDLDNQVFEMFNKSLFVIRSHTDTTSGGIIASGDTSNYTYGKDNYDYIWARDAYFPASVMAKLGYFSTPKKLIKFFSKVVSLQGYIMHKFEQDTSLGSSWHPWINQGNLELPIQEDETAAIVNLIYDYFSLTNDVEFLENHFNDLVEVCANFMCSFVNKKLGIPEPSYDLWESKYMVSTYTTASVIKALENASKLSKVLEKLDLEQRYSKSARTLRKGLVKELFDEKTNSFVKGVHTTNDGDLINTDYTVDASTFFSLWYYNILQDNDKKFIGTYSLISKRLRSENFYMARYENDDYFREEGTIKSNPWIISTLWDIQYLIWKSKTKSDLKEVPSRLLKVINMGTKSGLLPEQIKFNDKKPTSYCPLVWSHATFVETVYMYLSKLESLNLCKTPFPKQYLA